MPWHNRRYGVLVDELRVPVPPQQHAEIIEPGDDALQFHAVHQKDGERNFAFADVIEKSVLEILRTVGCHRRFPFLPAFEARESFVALGPSHASPVASFASLLVRSAMAQERTLDGTLPCEASAR